MVGDDNAEGFAREGRSTSGEEDEYEAVIRSYHDTVLSGKLRQSIHLATDRNGGGCLFPDDQCTKTGLTVVEVLLEKHPDMCVLPMENTMCTAFEEYEEVPETVPLDFTSMMSRWLYQSSPAHQVCCYQRRLS